MSYPNNCLSPQAIEDLANRNNSMLVGESSTYTIRKSPYASVITTGTIDNRSVLQRSIAIERALPSTSMVRPTFTPDGELCGTAGDVAELGSTEFEFQLEGIRGRGPMICYRQARTAWPSTYAGLYASLKQSLLDVTASDIRIALHDLSGCKLTATSGTAFEDAFAGEMFAVGTAYQNLTPDSPLSFRGLEITATHMREYLYAEPFDGDVDEGVAMFIAGQNQIQLLRDEADIREDIRALVTGRYKQGEETVTGYRFKGPYHGIAFGVDPLPLRADSVTAGQPNFVEPLVAHDVTVGTAGRINSAWVEAPYEVGFLVFKNSFKRLLPTEYKIAGFDFPAPISNDGLKFKWLDDADCHLFNDFGLHIWEILRAYQPVQPHAICPVLYKRCTSDLNLAAC
jgi:hypothetical protein